jgi:Flp pilus assembly secretin CpaC
MFIKNLSQLLKSKKNKSLQTQISQIAFFLQFVLVVNFILITTFSCSTASKKDNKTKKKNIFDYQNFDNEANLTQNDIEKIFNKNINKNNSSLKHKSTSNKNQNTPNEVKVANVPQFSRIIMSPPPPKIGGDKMISFSTTDQVPLKDALLELGRVANIDIDIDKNIDARIILNAKNRPLTEVLDRVASLANIRYSYKNGVLYFEEDKHYNKNYFVDFLSNSNIWENVEENIKEIINNSTRERATDNKDQNTSNGGSVKINKNAGLISVFANSQQHQNIEKYLKDVLAGSSSQVLIEAKVIEVTLGKDFQTGINWNYLGTKVGQLLTELPSSLIPVSSVFSNYYYSDTPKPALTLTMTLDKQNIDFTMRFLEQFGTMRALSSPRIGAMNNQESILDFSEKYIYFTVEATQSTAVAPSGNTGPSQNTTVLTYKKEEESIGTKLKITPSINIEEKEISLIIEPTLSTKVGDVLEPSINPSNGASLNNKIPLIKTRKLNTTAKIKSGEVLVIGGLLNESSINNYVGVPFFSRIPFIGALFRYKIKNTQTIETVIFIKATIIDKYNGVSKTDKLFHDKFTIDNKKFLNNK